jgi:phospholipid/cholesterol/gamma-HCH transport system permease protein
VVHGIAVAEPSFQIETSGDQLVVNLQGDWIFDNAGAIEDSLDRLDVPDRKAVQFRCVGLEHIDLTGAWLLYSKSLELEQAGHAAEFSGFRDVHMKFLSQVIERPTEPPPAPEKPSMLTTVLAFFGKGGVDLVRELGEMAVMTIDGLLRPSVLAFRETVNQLMDVGLKAIPIIVVMSFLIGLVLGYQASTQLGRLGAAAFTIDLVAISILREMGVLLTAVMVAGRSGSAFAAALGAMKLNEETDAMQVMGLSVNGTLVFPRILGLVIAVPLLTVFSDLAGIAGAWMVGVTLLDISTIEFLTRIVDAVDLDTVMVGLSKAPVFALLIGAVGTLRGLQVTASAEELGQLTTRAVVEAIFLVIIADAVFSIIYTELDI